MEFFLRYRLSETLITLLTINASTFERYQNIKTNIHLILANCQEVKLIILPVELPAISATLTSLGLALCSAKLLHCGANLPFAFDLKRS